MKLNLSSNRVDHQKNTLMMLTEWNFAFISSWTVIRCIDISVRVGVCVVTSLYTFAEPSIVCCAGGGKLVVVVFQNTTYLLGIAITNRYFIYSGI